MKNLIFKSNQIRLSFVAHGLKRQGVQAYKIRLEYQRTIENDKVSI
jgi:hypothetical protein